MSTFNNDQKQRIIQEFVPGKQVTLAHLIARPSPDIIEKLGFDGPCSAIGIMTLTPSETSIIASDMVLKVANTKIGFIDRFNGSLVFTGDVSDVEIALRQVSEFLGSTLGYSIAPITKS